ncbi:hydroxypyruvate isomerase family protein [Meridianimarinicoccus sp. RP-17]|uniref:hydroxypyruvate isomerase family protein n=1 Tax=Meridianimarinicoccus zhengii TaxID=2056810 RepID=UPI000DAC551C|nr:TIM barrel protein [Phycocomes zhengii]
MRFSANLGFLWADRSLPDAIHAAHRAGFAAVECHWPFDVPAVAVRAALMQTGLPMLSLNTRRGDVAAGEFGLSALPGREDEARAAIDEAIAYACATGARAVHVMAGAASGPRAHDAFCANLFHACAGAATHDITILIEPLNPRDAPGYFLSGTDQAAAIIRDLDQPNLRLMFDFYHVEIMEGAALCRFARLLPLVGHVQVASVPDRGPPDHGDLDYGAVFAELARLGWSRPVGAEYRSATATDETLGWMAAFRAPFRPAR